MIWHKTFSILLMGCNPMLTISYSWQFVNTEKQKKGGYKTRLKKPLTFLLRIALLYSIINFLKRD